MFPASPIWGAATEALRFPTAESQRDRDCLREAGQWGVDRFDSWEQLGGQFCWEKDGHSIVGVSSIAP